MYCYDKYNKNLEDLFLVKFRRKEAGIHLAWAEQML